MRGTQDKIAELRQNIYHALDSRNYDEAKTGIGELYKSCPQEALGLLTALNIEYGDVGAAKEACQKLQGMFGRDAYSVFLQARIAYMEHKTVTACNLLESISVDQLDRVYQEKIYNLLGQCYRFLGEGKKAAEVYQKAAQAADTPGLGALEYSNYLFNLHYQHLPLAEEKNAAAGYDRFFAHIVPKDHSHHDIRQKKLRIGYISPDFREHVCLYFVYGLLANANKERYTIFVYAANREDNYSRLLAGKVDVWRNIYGLSPQQAADVIYEDKIDILVDFSGHGKNNCLPVLAYRPAPVQISGIGHFASTGLSRVDYFLSDKFLAAKGAQAGFTEKLLLLPHSHLCYMPMTVSPLAPMSPSRKNGYITFGSFNNFTKLSADVLQVWREILQRVPDAHLLLKADVFSHVESAEYAKAKLKAAGLPMDRVECRPFTHDYLTQYQDMDIALDTFPYPGGGTSCDALYMGVPLISLAGTSQGERFGLSLLANLGLSELCADDYAGYIERAVLLASDAELLQHLHESLRMRMEKSPLMDVKQYAADVEERYEEIWREFCHKQSPKSSNRIKQIMEQLEKKIQEGDISAALSCAEQIWQNNPKDKKILERIAEIFLDTNKWEDVEKILHLLKDVCDGGSPYQAFLWANLYFQQKEYDKALCLLNEAIDSGQLEKSRLGAAYHLMAQVYQKQGIRDKAAKAYFASSQCKDLSTGKHTDYSNYLLNLAFNQEPEKAYVQAAMGYGEIMQVVSKLPALTKVFDHKKLRIGYLSADFNRHVVACFAQALFTNMDDNLFIIYGYQLGNSDEVTEHFVQCATVWRDLRGLELFKAAQIIREDEIDILVDLGGHTAHNGLPLLACRPAPVQLSAIGYFASTGMPAVDYFLVDKYTAIDGEEAYFTEKLLRLPHSHICWQPLSGHKHLITAQPAAHRGYITFGSLNQRDKVTDEMLKTWGQILQAMPSAKLFLKAGIFDDVKRCQQEKKRLAVCGIPLARIQMEGYSEDYLSAYGGIDIALDTYPYPGGGTSCDALYMGVPVISLCGNTHHGRFGYSLLENAGLTDLCVADTLSEYVEKAVSLGQDIERLKDLRQNIRRKLQQTAVMNGELYMADLEAAYLQIWADYAKKFTNENQTSLSMAEDFYKKRDWSALIELAAKAYYVSDRRQQWLLARYLTFAYYQQKNHVKTIFWSKIALQGDKHDMQMVYLQASAYDQAGYLDRALDIAENALAAREKLSAELYKLFCHLSSLIAYKLGHSQMSAFYWRSFMVEKEADMYSSYLLTFNCQDVSSKLVTEKALGYGRLFRDVLVFDHGHHPQHKRLRIGYISPDFRFHVMYKFYQVLLGGHDPVRYEIYAYSLTDKQDRYTKICASLPDHWCDLQGFSPQQAAQRIYDDEIDILFDLAGHTAGGALKVLARKPAPVQISGIGYMATTGLNTVDYFVTDSFVDPWGQNDEFFTEKLIRLTSQFCYTPERADLPASTGTPCQSRGWILFGIFNAYRKFTQEMLVAWKEILAIVPNSKLLLKCQVFFAPTMVESAYKRFREAGFDMERVIFEPADRNYMQRYLDVDIALDTYPYPGGGTTCDALYMGVPVITRFSSRHSTRFSYSLLKNIGLGELATASSQEYIQRAVALAEDRELLNLLHKNLRNMMLASPVMNCKAYICELENYYQKIWHAANKGD